MATAVGRLRLGRSAPSRHELRRRTSMLRRMPRWWRSPGRGDGLVVEVPWRWRSALGCSGSASGEWRRGGVRRARGRLLRHRGRVRWWRCLRCSAGCRWWCSRGRWSHHWSWPRVAAPVVVPPVVVPRSDPLPEPLVVPDPFPDPLSCAWAGAASANVAVASAAVMSAPRRNRPVASNDVVTMDPPPSQRHLLARRGRGPWLSSAYPCVRSRNPPVNCCATCQAPRLHIRAIG